MRVPNWWEAILLIGAAWRTWHLIARDDIAAPLRSRIRSEKLADFIDCPYCFGFWLAVAWWGAWQIWPHGTLVVGTSLMLSTGVVALSRLLTPE